MARPKRDDTEARSAHVAARFTAAERLALDERAAAAGLTLSEFVRAAALDREPPRAAMPAGPAGVMSAEEVRELNRIGQNLNQAVRAIHTGNSDPDVVALALLEAVSRLDAVWDRYLP